jgi:hypothetical protein
MVPAIPRRMVLGWMLASGCLALRRVDQSAVLLVGVGGIDCGCSIPDKLKFYDIDFWFAGAVMPCL